MDSTLSPPLSKRRSIIRNQTISPPPLRRRNLPEPITDESQPSMVNASIRETSTLEIRDSNLFEIISWNVNGISHLLPPTTQPITEFFSKREVAAAEASEEDSEANPDKRNKSPLREFLRRHKFPQIVCLQEVKIPRDDEKLKGAVERAANLTSKGEDEETPVKYEAHFSLPRDKFNATGWGGKVYGVCTLIRNEFHAMSREVGYENGSIRTKDASWDTEGRVLITEILPLSIVVINGYWPNGTTNAWKSSNTGATIGTRHDAKRAFHSKMLSDVKKYEAQGKSVVLIGDMNVARSPLDGYPGIRTAVEHLTNRKDFNEKFFDAEDGMKGIDTWRWVHGNKRGYTYHGEKKVDWGRSCDRVDLGIVSRRIVNNGVLVGAQIWESVEERGGSDHVPLSVVLDAVKLRSNPKRVPEHSLSL